MGNTSEVDKITERRYTVQASVGPTYESDGYILNQHDTPWSVHCYMHPMKNNRITGKFAPK